MGLFASIKKRLTIQIVAIGLEEKKCNITVKQIKNSKELDSSQKSFDIKSKELLGKEVVDYLNDLQSSNEQTYVSLFLNTLGQGVVSGCEDGDFDKLGIESDSIKRICVDNNFSVYASLIDLKWIHGIFQNVGLDYIYSPFLVLNRCIKESKQNDAVLYILRTNNGMTLMVKNSKKLLYGSFFNIAKEANMLHEDFDDLDDDAKFEDELLEEIEIDDDFTNDDVNEIDDVMDFMEESEISHNLPVDDTRFIKYLTISLKEFYESDLYESEFITKIEIYNASLDISKELIKHLEDDLLLEINVNSVDLLDIVAQLAKKEIYLNA